LSSLYERQKSAAEQYTMRGWLVTSSNCG